MNISPGVLPEVIENDVRSTVAGEQTGAGLVTITDGFEFTFMATAFEVAGLPLWQVSLDVRTTVITSPSAGMYEYVGLSAPTVVAPLYHW